MPCNQHNSITPAHPISARDAELHSVADDNTHSLSLTACAYGGRIVGCSGMRPRMQHFNQRHVHIIYRESHNATVHQQCCTHTRAGPSHGRRNASTWNWKERQQAGTCCSRTQGLGSAACMLFDEVTNQRTLQSYQPNSKPSHQRDTMSMPHAQPHHAGD